MNLLSSSAQNNNAPPPPPPPAPPVYDTVYSPSSSNDSNKVYDLVAIEKPPVFPGGESAMINFLRNNVTYPKLAKENNIQGKVYLSFIIDKTGDVTNVSVRRGATVPKDLLDKYADNEKKLESLRAMARELDEEAIRVVRLMPRWEPGVQNKKVVKVVFLLPINFTLK